MALGEANVNRDLCLKVLTVGPGPSALFDSGVAWSEKSEQNWPQKTAKAEQLQCCNACNVLSAKSGLRLMVLTSYFTTKKDWQRGKYAKPSFSKIQSLDPKSGTGFYIKAFFEAVPFVCDWSGLGHGGMHVI